MEQEFPTHPPVKAWRCFDMIDNHLEPPHLVSPMFGDEKLYPNQVYKASCIHDSYHEVPKFDCTCGFYAFKKRRDARGYLRKAIMAEVLLGGKIIETETGYRAEQMIIVKLYPIKKEVDHVERYI